MSKGVQALVGRGSRIAKGYRNAQCLFVSISGASSKNCRAVGGATRGSAASRSCVQYTDKVPFLPATTLGSFRSLALPQLLNSLNSQMTIAEGIMASDQLGDSRARPDWCARIAGE